MAFREHFIKRWKIYFPIIFGIFITLLFLMFVFKEDVKRGRVYTDRKDVALYIKKYHELPKNYITKAGKEYYSNKNADMSNYLIGGDTFYNDGKLYNYGISNDAMLKECDIYFEGYSCTSNRGSYRLVYETNTSDMRVFSTNDHYSSFNEITLFEIMPAYFVFLIILVIYSVSIFIFWLCIFFPHIKKALSKNDNDNKKQLN